MFKNQFIRILAPKDGAHKEKRFVLSAFVVIGKTKRACVSIVSMVLRFGASIVREGSNIKPFHVFIAFPYSNTLRCNFIDAR